MYNGKKIIVVTGGYNEEGKIGNVIRNIPKFADKIIAVDDGSIDNTAKEAEEAGAAVLKNKQRMGAGYVIRKGINYAIRNGYDIIVIIAGDFQDNPHEIESLIKPLFNGFDFAQGSRFLNLKSRIPFFRLITSRAFSMVFRHVTHSSITDASNGFRAFNANLIKEINLNHQWLNGYELETYFLINVVKKHYKIKEVPVTKSYNKCKGYSKMRPFIDWYRICKPLFKELFTITINY